MGKRFFASVLVGLLAGLGSLAVLAGARSLLAWSAKTDKESDLCKEPVK